MLYCIIFQKFVIRVLLVCVLFVFYQNVFICWGKMRVMSYLSSELRLCCLVQISLELSRAILANFLANLCIMFLLILSDPWKSISCTMICLISHWKSVMVSTHVPIQYFRSIHSRLRFRYMIQPLASFCCHQINTFCSFLILTCVTLLYIYAVQDVYF